MIEEKKIENVEQASRDISQLEELISFEKRLFEEYHQTFLQKIYNYHERIKNLKKIIELKLNDLKCYGNCLYRCCQLCDKWEHDKRDEESILI